MEGLHTRAAGELLVLGVAFLVRSQSGGAAEAFQADFTAEGFDSVQFSPRHPTANLHRIFVIVHQLLVLLQLAVVEKRLPTEVTHERLLNAVDEHVRLQCPGS